MTTVHSGLEGIVVAATRLSDVDGDAGKLRIAGADVEDLAGSVSFEEACLRLWEGRAPTPDETRALSRRLGALRVAVASELGRAPGLASFADGMDALRAGLARLDLAALGAPAAREALTAAVPVVVSAWWHARAGSEPPAPDADASHARDLLRLVGRAAARDDAHAAARAAALETYLVCVMDHGMNASTFAARVVASTGSDPVSAIVAGVGALKGPLHGGAPGPVLDMLDAVGAPDRAASWIEAELAAGRRIMGMGHRIYRVRDPRAAVLERATQKLEATGIVTERLALARAVERVATDELARRYPSRPLKANVEFYTAVLLDAVGLDRALFAPTFAAGRVAGWCAHVEEQVRDGRLIRPASIYVGA